MSVARPTKWGNPFWHVAKFHGIELSLRLFGEMANGCWKPNLIAALPEAYGRSIYEVHQGWIKRLGGHPIEMIRSELRGHLLACWCKLDEDCHGDILAEIANG